MEDTFWHDGFTRLLNVLESLDVTSKTIADSNKTIAHALTEGRYVRFGRLIPPPKEKAIPTSEPISIMRIGESGYPIPEELAEFAARLEERLAMVDSITSVDTVVVATGKQHRETGQADRNNASRLMSRWGWKKCRANKADGHGKRPEYWRRMPGCLPAIVEGPAAV